MGWQIDDLPAEPGEYEGLHPAVAQTYGSQGVVNLAFSGDQAWWVLAALWGLYQDVALESAEEGFLGNLLSQIDDTWDDCGPNDEEWEPNFETDEIDISGPRYLEMPRDFFARLEEDEACDGG